VKFGGIKTAYKYARVEASILLYRHLKNRNR
jgi:hypothetical protein